eukprot:3736773-Amphidinium_carterae.4
MEEVVTRLQQLEAVVQAQQPNNQELCQALHQADLEIAALKRAATAAASSAPTSSTTASVKPLVDTKLLSKPQTCNGEQAQWPSWSLVFGAYCEVVCPDLGRLMKAHEAKTLSLAISCI